MCEYLFWSLDTEVCDKINIHIFPSRGSFILPNFAKDGPWQKDKKQTPTMSGFLYTLMFFTS